MIKGTCRTNLDGYEHAKWPEVFVAVPRIGERVQSETGKLLYVVGITHLYNRMEPYIEVELNKENG